MPQSGSVKENLQQSRAGSVRRESNLLSLSIAPGNQSPSTKILVV